MALTKKEKTELQKEVVDVLEYQPHGLLWLAQRMGKTKIIIDLIKRDKYNSILWVTPSADLATKDIPQEFEKWKAKRFIPRLTTTTYASLHKMVGFFDIVILDEVQFLTENNVKNLLNRSIDYISIIGMTGTPTKHEHKQDIYKELGLKSLYKVNLNKAVDIGLLADYKMTVVNVPMEAKKAEVEAGRKGAKFYTTEQGNYNYLSAQVDLLKFGSDQNKKMFAILARMRAVHNSKSKLRAAKKLISKLEGRILIFASNIKQAEELCSNVYHSKTNGESLRAFKNFEIDKLALVNSGGTGHTYKKIDNLILVQADSNKNGISGQKIARTLLAQKGYVANIWIICLKHSQDDVWVKNTLEDFDSTKVKYLNIEDL